MPDHADRLRTDGIAHGGDGRPTFHARAETECHHVSQEVGVLGADEIEEPGEIAAFLAEDFVDQALRRHDLSGSPEARGNGNRVVGPPNLAIGLLVDFVPDGLPRFSQYLVEVHRPPLPVVLFEGDPVLHQGAVEDGRGKEDIEAVAPGFVERGPLVVAVVRLLHRLVGFHLIQGPALAPDRRAVAAEHETDVSLIRVRLEGLHHQPPGPVITKSVTGLASLDPSLLVPVGNDTGELRHVLGLFDFAIGRRFIRRFAGGPSVLPAVFGRTSVERNSLAARAIDEVVQAREEVLSPNQRGQDMVKFIMVVVDESR